MINRSERFTQSPGTLSTTSAAETIILNPTNGRYYGLSNSAALAWAALAEPRTTEEVIDSVLRRLSDLPTTSAADLTAFIADLEREGLILPAPPTASQATPTPSPEALVPYSHPRLEIGVLSRAAHGVSGTPDGATTGFGADLLS